MEIEELLDWAHPYRQWDITEYTEFCVQISPVKMQPSMSSSCSDQKKKSMQCYAEVTGISVVISKWSFPAVQRYLTDAR